MAEAWPRGLRQQFAKLRGSKKPHTGSNPVASAILAGLNRGGRTHCVRRVVKNNPGKMRERFFNLGYAEI